MDIDAIKKEKGKLIGTIIFGLLTSFLLFSLLFNYYFGIKAKTQESKEEYTVAETNVPVNSIGVLENYNKIHFTACSNTLASIFYKKSLINVSDLNNDEKITILYYYFSDSCGNPVIVTTEQMNTAVESIFGSVDISFINTTNFSVSNEGTQFTITPLNCNNCDNSLTRQITKATTAEDKLYIYEQISDGTNISNYKWTFTKNAYNTYYLVSIESI